MILEGIIMRKPALLVLAAGMGSRYGGLKQIDSVGPEKEAIIDYSVYDAVKSGFGKVVFLIRKEIEAEFRQHVGNRFEKHIEVEYAFQETDKLPEGFSCPPERVKPWGTGHAVLCAEKYLNEPFAVINGDDFYGREGIGIVARHLEALNNDSTEYAMVGYTLRNTLSDNGTVSRGVCEITESGYLKDVVERTSIEKRGEGAVALLNDRDELVFSGDETVSLNLFGFTPSIFNYLREEFTLFLKDNLETPKAEFYIPGVVDTLIKSNRASVKVLHSAGDWFGITYSEDKPQVISRIGDMIREGVYPSGLWS